MYPKQYWQRILRCAVIRGIYYYCQSGINIDIQCPKKIRQNYESIREEADATYLISKFVRILFYKLVQNLLYTALTIPLAGTGDMGLKALMLFGERIKLFVPVHIVALYVLFAFSKRHYCFDN